MGVDEELDILTEMRERFALVQNSGDIDQRDKALDDIKFANTDDQWEPQRKKDRKDRPCYTFNRTAPAINQVIGDQRQSRPAIKVRAVDSTRDPKLANTFAGLIRNIEATSNAAQAYDTAFKFSVTGGYGVLGLCTEYSDEKSFDQDIKIETFDNPFAVYFDPHCKDILKRDAMFAFEVEEFGKEEFKARWPKAAESSVDEALFKGDGHDWYGEDIRVVKYWRRRRTKLALLQLSDGRIVVDDEAWAAVADEEEAAGVTVKRERSVDTFVVECFLCSGTDILEGPTEWPGRTIPRWPVWGRRIYIEGEGETFRGMVRLAKDAQRSYNYSRSTAIETIALAPKAPWLVTPRMIKNFVDSWKNSNVENQPYLAYDPDPQALMGPTRQHGAEPPAALREESMIAAEEIKVTTERYDASLGARSNETSGRAILARESQGDTATYEYIDNLNATIRSLGAELVEIIPKVYDTQRTVRIFGEDGKEEFVTLYEEVRDEQTGNIVKVNDLGQGRFDVYVDTGPSFSTRRTEMTETILDIMRSDKQLGMLLADLFVKSLDIPNADEFVRRVRRYMIQQGLVEPTEEELAAMPQPQGPDPQEQLAQALANAELALTTAKAAEATAKARNIDAETMAKLPAEVRKIVAETMEIAMESAMRRVLAAPAVRPPGPPGGVVQ